MEIWLTVQEVSVFEGKNERTVRRYVASGAYKVIEESCPGKGVDAKRYLIALSSLTPEAQAAYYDTKKPKDSPASVSDDERPPINLAVLKDLGGQAAVKSFTERVEMVKEARRIQDLRLDVVSNLEALSEDYGISVKTLYDWLQAYDNEGEVGLLSKPARKKMEHAGALGPKFGKRGFGEAAIDFMTALYLSKTRPKVRYVYERTLEEAQARISEALNEEEAQDLRERWKVGSYQTACRYIDELPANVVAYGREGYETYRNKHMPKARLDYSKLKINEVWVGDGHQLDVFVEHEGKAIRPWLSSWQDLRSRAITGWCLSPQGNSETIGLGLRHGILRKPGSPVCGVPSAVYIDNGKDYQGKHLAGGLKHAWKFDYTDDERGVFSSLGIEANYCTARTPWAKGTKERWYQTLEVSYLHQLPGYCGSNNKARPDGFDEKKLLKQGKLLSLQQMAELIEKSVVLYHSAIHSSLKGTPLSVYEALPKAREGVPDARALDVLLMKADRRKVSTTGVRMNGKYYTHPILDSCVGDAVTVRYDPGNIEELLIFSGTTYICTAKLNYTEFGNAEALEEHMIRQKRSQKAVKDAVNGFKERAGLKKPLHTGTTDENGSYDMIIGFEQAAREAAADRTERTEPPALPKKISLREQWMEKQGKKALGL